MVIVFSSGIFEKLDYALLLAGLHEIAGSFTMLVNVVLLLCRGLKIGKNEGFIYTSQQRFPLLCHMSCILQIGSLYYSVYG